MAKREQDRPPEPPGSPGDPNAKEYWVRHWNVFNDPQPTSRRAAILGYLLIPLIVGGSIAIALLFPDAR